MNGFPLYINVIMSYSFMKALTLVVGQSYSGCHIGKYPRHIALECTCIVAVHMQEYKLYFRECETTPVNSILFLFLHNTIQYKYNTK